MIREDTSTEARRYALGLLARREYTEKELAVKVSRKVSISGSSINDIVAKLKEDGYLSDVRYTEAYIRSRSRRGFGRDRIEMELAEKGVEASLVSAALAEYEPEWPALIYQVWRKKFYAVPADYAAKVKQHNFLRYRGFRQGDIEALYRDLVRD